MDDITALIRHALTTGGGALVSQGLLTQSQVTDAVGALAVVVGVAWSLYQKYQTRQALASVKK